MKKASVQQNFDCVVVGAGIIGGTLALALQRLGLKVALLEKYLPKFSLDLQLQARASAITKSSENILTKLGIWQHIKRKHPFTAMHIKQYNAVNLEHYLELNADDARLDNLGHIIENLAIQDAIFNAIFYSNKNQSEPIQIIEIEKLISLSNTIKGASLTCETKNKNKILQLNTKLLFGADGAISKVRELAKIDLKIKDYQQFAIVGSLQFTESHQNKCWQTYHPSGPLAFLAMQENFVSLAWYHKTQDLEKYQTLIKDKNQFKLNLEKVSEKKFGRIKQINQLAIYPLYKRNATKYYENKVILVGDSAHTIHPQAGQGINIGLLDMATIIDCLIDTEKQNIDLEYKSLKKYQILRGLDNALMQNSMDMFSKMFDLQPLPILGDNMGSNSLNIDKPKLVNYFLKLANKSTLAKNILIKNAIYGRLGFIPSLAK